MKINNQQLVALIDFSPSLDFQAKLRWRSYVPYLAQDEKERLFKFLNDEKQSITNVLKQKMKGFRAYFFAKGVESLEQEFIQKHQ